MTVLLVAFKRELRFESRSDSGLPKSLLPVIDDYSTVFFEFGLGSILRRLIRSTLKNRPTFCIPVRTVSRDYDTLSRTFLSSFRLRVIVASWVNCNFGAK